MAITEMEVAGRKDGGIDLTTDRVELIKSKNYKMYVEKEKIRGFVDEKEAMKQVVGKILSTERYKFLIYSWNYGVELEDLFGENVSFVCLEVKGRIKEALLQDNRIESVENFEFDTSRRRVVAVSFTVVTVFGSFDYEKEVEY